MNDAAGSGAHGSSVDGNRATARSQSDNSDAHQHGALITDLTRTHYPLLDGLRGLAILLVMFYHFSLPHRHFHGHEGGWLLQLAQGGWLGVDLFFVLSGFLITGILIETRNQAHYFRNFLGRRFLRIWPLYYLSLMILLIALPLVLPSVPEQLQGMRDKQAWFWLYGANWLFASEGGFSQQTSGGYLWSLAVEEQFYILWPLVVYALPVRNLLRVSIALLGLSLLSRIALIHFGVGTGAVYTMTFTHLDGLAVGSALAVCARSQRLTATVRRWLPVAAVLAALGLVAVRLSDGDAFFWSRYMATYGYTFAAVLFGALLVWVISGRAALGLPRALNSRFMRQCGKYSYALYVVHVPVASAMFPIGRRILEPVESSIGYDGVFVGNAALSFAASWILAALSWNLFEKRILALKHFFSYEGEALPRVARAAADSTVNTHRG